MSKETSSPRRKRAVTIKDIVRVTGVSRMTVSRALTEPKLVKAETLDRVLQAISELGYVPDRAAVSLSSRRSGFVALVLPTLTNFNFSMLAHGLTDALRARNFTLLICYTNYDLEEEELQLRALLARRPEAVVLAGTVHNAATAAMLARADVPVVEVADFESDPIEHIVGFSNEEVGQIAARYLINKGFSRIGAIASLPQTALADHRGEARIRGFARELQRQGFSAERLLRIGDAPVSFDHGAVAIRSLLESHPDTEAVFCISDPSAVGAMMECQRLGIGVPDTLSIMGFGDFEVGSVTVPRLTSIRADFHEIGKAAGKLVIDILGDPTSAEPRRIRVDLGLIERESVADQTQPGASESH